MTTTSNRETLAQQVKRGLSEARDGASVAIRDMASIADELGVPDTRDRLREVEAKLMSHTFKLGFCGRFNVGKSTVLNALLGGTTKDIELAGHHGPMVVDDLPATAILTEVRYAERPYVKAWGFDGKSESWTLAKYLNESTLDIDEEENTRKFDQIKQFEMGFPASLCEAGVQVFDSPGLDEHPKRNAVTTQATKRCDAAIVMYRSDVLMGHSELMNEDNLIAAGTRVFTLINLWDSRPVDDRLRGFVWNKYVRDHLGGPRWANQDLAERDIYFVDGARARRGVYEGDRDAVSASGLLAFEERLARFLTTERQQVHLAKFATQAENLAAALAQQIQQRELATTADQAALRETAQTIRPRLEEIRNRPSRLPALIQRYLADAQTAVQTSFVDAVGQLRAELPDHLAATALPSAGVLYAAAITSRLQREAATAISDFATLRVAAWSENEVPLILAPLLERLADDVRSEVTHVSRQLDEINFELTGWHVDAESKGPLVGRGERVMATVVGLMFGDLSSAVGGGAAGWRGAAGGVTGALGSAFLLGALGLAGAPIFLPATLVAAMAFAAFGGKRGLEGRVKKRALADTDEILRELPAQSAPTIDARLVEQFALLEETVLAELASVIAEEARNIEEIIELNSRDQSDRERALHDLTRAAAALEGHRESLRQVLTTARQAG